MAQLYKVKIRFERDRGVFHAIYWVAANSKQAAETVLRYRLDTKFQLTSCEKVSDGFARHYLRRAGDVEVSKATGQPAKPSIGEPDPAQINVFLSGAIMSRRGRAEALRKLSGWFNRMAEHIDGVNNCIPNAGVAEPQSPLTGGTFTIGPQKRVAK